MDDGCEVPTIEADVAHLDFHAVAHFGSLIGCVGRIMGVPDAEEEFAVVDGFGEGGFHCCTSSDVRGKKDVVSRLRGWSSGVVFGMWFKMKLKSLWRPVEKWMQCNSSSVVGFCANIHASRCK